MFKCSPCSTGLLCRRFLQTYVPGTASLSIRAHPLWRIKIRQCYIGTSAAFSPSPLLLARAVSCGRALVAPAGSHVHLRNRPRSNTASEAVQSGSKHDDLRRGCLSIMVQDDCPTRTTIVEDACCVRVFAGPKPCSRTKFRHSVLRITFPRGPDVDGRAAHIDTWAHSPGTRRTTSEGCYWYSPVRFLYDRLLNILAHIALASHSRIAS